MVDDKIVKSPLLFLAQIVIAQLNNGHPCVIIYDISALEARNLIQHIGWLTNGMDLDEKFNQMNLIYHNNRAAEIWLATEYEKAQKGNLPTPICMN